MNLQDYEALIRRITREVFFYLQKLGASAADAQDIVQDAFVKLIETEQIIPEPKIRAWMYRSSIRLWIDRTRRHQRYRVVSSDYQALMTQWQWPATGDLNEALQRLDDSEMLLFTLRYIQGFSVKQIAQMMAFSESKTKVTLFRIRQKLKQWLEEDTNE